MVNDEIVMGRYNNPPTLQEKVVGWIILFACLIVLLLIFQRNGINIF